MTTLEATLKQEQVRFNNTSKPTAPLILPRHFHPLTFYTSTASTVHTASLYKLSCFAIGPIDTLLVNAGPLRIR